MGSTSGAYTANRRSWRGLRWGVPLVLAAVAAWLSIRQVQWASLKAALAHPHWPLLALALVTVLATTGAKAARWQVLLRQCGSRARGARVLRVLLIGQMGNSFLPARLGDLGRAILLGPQASGGIPAVLGTVVVEKALDGVMGLLVLVGLALWTPLPAWLRQPMFAFSLVTGILLVLLLLSAMRREWSKRIVDPFLRRLPSRTYSRARNLLGSFGLGLGLIREPGAALLALAWSALVWGLGALTNVVALAALDIQAPGWSTWLVLVTGYVANFLPAVPAQVGIFEYACILALTAAGVSHEPALAFGLVLHLLVYGPPAVLGPVSTAIEGLSWNRLRQVHIEWLERSGAPD
jgi:uncharacterized protein (TIRG00374 family)